MIPPEIKDETLPKAKGGSDRFARFLLPLLFGSGFLAGTWLALENLVIDDKILPFVTAACWAWFVLLVISAWVNSGNKLIERYVDAGIGTLISVASFRIYYKINEVAAVSDASQLAPLDKSLFCFFVVGAVILVFKSVSALKNR